MLEVPALLKDNDLIASDLETGKNKNINRRKEIQLLLPQGKRDT